MEKAELVLFNGRKYYRCKSQRYFSTAYDYKNRKGGRRLHRDVWEFYSGKKIPKGYHVHHKDGNWLNNDFENLVCLSPKEYYQQHLDEIRKVWERPDMQEARNRGREKCKEWHHSEEAKKWHSKHQKEYIKKILISVECEECGKTFNTFNDKRRQRKCHKCRDRELHRLIRQKKKNSV